jgi:hypothetical protein
VGPFIFTTTRGIRNEIGAFGEISVISCIDITITHQP